MDHKQELEDKDYLNCGFYRRESDSRYLELLHIIDRQGKEISELRRSIDKLYNIKTALIIVLYVFIAYHIVVDIF